MRFTASLQFNAVQDWLEYYLKYPSHKKLLHSLERARWQVDKLEGERVKAKESDIPAMISLEDISSASSVASNLENSFHESFSSDFKRVCEFYVSKKNELMAEVSRLKSSVKLWMPFLINLFQLLLNKLANRIVLLKKP